MPRNETPKPAMVKPATLKAADPAPTASKPAAPRRPAAPRAAAAVVVVPAEAFAPPEASDRAEAPVPFDRAADPAGPALDALASELAATGRRARNRKAQVTAARPDLAFAAALRTRLAPLAMAPALAGLPSDAMAHPVHGPRPASQAARGRTASRRPWAIAGLAVVVVAAAALALSSGVLRATDANRAGDTSGATLIRGGGSQALVAGTSLSAGDEVRVATSGNATLLLGSSQARLAGGADLRIDTLDSSTVRLALLAGRAYDRVVLPAGGSYAVVTGPYTWTATGTAFDLNRVPDPAGGEQVTLLDLEHTVAVAGPGGSRQIAEGSSVSVIFGSPGSDGLTVGPIPATDFTDPWLIANAKADEALGYPIGALAGVALAPNDTPSPTPSPTNAPTTSPSGSPDASATTSPTPEPTGTLNPTPRPTPTPTASPSPSPSPTGTPQPTLSLSPNSCYGGVLLSWSKYTGTGFSKYVLLRSLSPNIPRAYPAAGTTLIASSSVRTTTSAADATVVKGFTYFYRTLVLGPGSTVLAASDVESALGLGVLDMGPASVGAPYVVWSIYNQSAACFSEYRVQYSSDSGFGGQVGTIIVPSLKTTNVKVPAASGFSSGDTIYFRVQVVYLTSAGFFLVGQTSGNPPSYTYP